MSGRPKAYDRNKIIEIAKDLFWVKGYAGTSLSDLTQAMNVSKSTFYSAFESKDALYEICLHEYGKEFFREILHKVTGKDTVISSLRNYYKEIALENAGDTPAKGCFLVSAANEVGLTHERLSPVIQDLLNTAKTTLKNALELAIRKNELPASLNSDTHAIYFLNQMCGLRTMVKSGADPQELADLVDQMFIQRDLK